MPKQPVLYEAMYILDSALDEAGVQTAVETLEKFVTDNGGEVVATREFGKRRLAYEIEGHTTGTYMILYFKSFGELVAEVQHEFRLIDGVVRGIICVANPKALFDPKPEVVEAPAAEEVAEEAAEEPAAAEEVAAEAAAEEAAPEEAPAEEPVAEEAPAEAAAAEPAAEEEAPATEEEA